MDQKTHIIQIVGDATFMIGQPISKDATGSKTADANIDFRSYISEGSFTLTSAAVDNTGQNRKKSMQYGQESATASMTFFSVNNNDPNNPLVIFRKAKAQRLAVPIFFKEHDGTYAEGFDGDMICETNELPIPGENEIKVNLTLHPCTVYRIWKSLSEDWPETPPETED